MNKLVSVIMSTYNEPLEWVEESIMSIINQTYLNIELIIVLDNPKNKDVICFVENISKNYQNIRVIRNKNNIGLVSSLNKALDICKGYYIARMDADDISESDRIERQVNYLENNNLDFVFSGLKIIDEKSNDLYCTNIKEMSYKKISKILKFTNISNHPTWLLKKDIYLNLNGYREINYTEDYDFILRALYNGYIIGKMNGYVLKYRVRSTSISRSYSLLQNLNSQIILKAYRNNLIMDNIEIKNMLDKAIKISTEKECEKFSKAEKIFSEGVFNIKNSKKIKGTCKILKSFTLSKYFRIKILKLFIYKIMV